ncbi:MAG: hypothetical protein PVSMB11_06890 [Desulfuromonadaceae bacterium]
MSTRKFSRVHFKVGATIRIADLQFQGAVENLSMAGMFLVTNEQLAEGEAVDITIVLTGALPEIAVNFNGIVTRIAEDGVGLTFEKMDLDSYMHLKNIIAYNIDDAEKVMEEIGHSIDEKFLQRNKDRVQD